MRKKTLNALTNACEQRVRNKKKIARNESG